MVPTRPKLVQLYHQWAHAICTGRSSLLGRAGQPGDRGFCHTSTRRRSAASDGSDRVGMLSSSARSCAPQTLHEALSMLYLLPWQVLPVPFCSSCAAEQLQLRVCLCGASGRCSGHSCVCGQHRRVAAMRRAADQMVGILTVLPVCGVRPMAAAVAGTTCAILQQLRRRAAAASSVPPWRLRRCSGHCCRCGQPMRVAAMMQLLLVSWSVS